MWTLRVLKLVLVLTLIVPVKSGFAQLATTSAPVPPTLYYFALGDSIASGHGLNDDWPNKCRRSGEAYPAQVRDGLAITYKREVIFKNLACTGAVTDFSSAALSEDPNKWFDNQVSATIAAARSVDSTAVVSITIGADDFGWADALDRKSTRLTPVTAGNVVCRLVLEKKKGVTMWE